MNTMYRMVLPIEFTSGLCAGGFCVGNQILLERNGKNEPVLRGSTIAGRLRHAFMTLPDDFFDRADLDKIFGYSPSGREDDITAGCLIVEDAILQQGKGKTEFRMCHLRDRHKGRVVDKGLFAVEMCPPGTRADLVLWLTSEFCEETPWFARVVRAFLEQGMVFGGNGNRGLGMAKLRQTDVPAFYAYKLNDIDEYAAWLDARDGNVKMNGSLEIPRSDIPQTGLRISLAFNIPEGQDIIIGQGAGETRQAEPAVSIGYDGKPYWTIPGSTFHGLLRQWVTRLAARDGYHVTDATERYDPLVETNGDMIGWCFDPDNADAHNNCPIAKLFGSLHRAGRVHCTGAFALAGEIPKKDVKQYAGVQERTHVAIDPISGGAVNHMLFKTAVLTSEYKDLFKTDWHIEAPDEKEAEWIGRTIMAIDMGLIRIGSSKASGRLRLVKPPDVSGIHAEVITRMTIGGGND
ncbi:RAMP superfamily CRISPR-associated protein [Desulfobacter curvatus]|uniref:RAMP superfamily CRISPR-associated protein n=1 Tax=Desulfobacter curvatus TaxID=2290 RepID=UPI00037C6EA2|nr:RAMP superfamily CRISPR-associated protein [Desulfobacter curvatus]